MKCVGGGFRGLGSGFRLRFFAQGSVRERRFFLLRFLERASSSACLVWERRTRLLVEICVAVAALAGTLRIVRCCDW
jgi:hypothetical protein